MSQLCFHALYDDISKDKYSLITFAHTYKYIRIYKNIYLPMYDAQKMSDARDFF